MDSKHQPRKRYEEEIKRNSVELLETSGRPIAEVTGELGDLTIGLTKNPFFRSGV